MKVKETNKVLEELAELRFKRGYSRGALVSYLKEKYGLKLSRSYELIRMMFDKIGEVYAETISDSLVESIEFLENLKQSSLGMGDKRLALEIQKELNKIKQLYIQKIEANINIEQPLFSEIIKDTEETEEH